MGNASGIYQVVDGVGGAAFGAAEEGVEVEGMGEPFGWEDGGDGAGGSGDVSGETAGAESGTVDKEVELVGGGAAIATAVEGDSENAFSDTGGGNGSPRHGALADNDAGVVDAAVGGEAILIKFAEEGVGAVVLTDRPPMETYKMGILHIGRELGNLREVAAV